MLSVRYIVCYCSLVAVKWITQSRQYSATAWLLPAWAAAADGSTGAEQTVIDHNKARHWMDNSPRHDGGRVGGVNMDEQDTPSVAGILSQLLLHQLPYIIVSRLLLPSSTPSTYSWRRCRRCLMVGRAYYQICQKTWRWFHNSQYRLSLFFFRWPFGDMTGGKLQDGKSI